MATVVNVNEIPGGGRVGPPEWATRYPPLATLAIALVIAILVLPSSLNQPQANPTTTVELAPVPPSNESSPPIGNLNQLGLGQSSTVNAGGALGGDTGGLGNLPSPNPGGSCGNNCRNNKTKDCVKLSDGKVHQTEDPLSPPCVPYFATDADNGGATYQGVTKDDINVVFYEDGASFTTPTARGTDTYPTNTLIDLDAPPQQGEPGQYFTRRAWEQYFNNRYQTYNRHVHFYIYYGNATGTPEARQADATQAYSQIPGHPFATISATQLSGASDDFLVFMARRGVLNFGSLSGRTEAFFNQFPRMIWGYPPAIEFMGRNYADFVCKTLVHKPVSFGQTADKGHDRVFAIMRTSDSTYPNLSKLADYIKQQVQSCGGVIKDEFTYPKNNFYLDTESPPAYANTNMAKAQADKITTILWTGGVEEKQSAAAQQIGYTPEWVTLGDGFMEANGYGQAQSQSVWNGHVVTVTPTVKIVPLDNQICYQAYRSADPTAADSDVANYACLDYDNLRQLFTGIQVAGPKLGPSSIDRGYHAIPSVQSIDPRLPACYYEPADYTCVKDLQAEYWDTTGQAASSNQPGCYREFLGGKRFRTGDWPNQDPVTLKGPNDPCNNYDNTQLINNRPPNPNG